MTSRPQPNANIKVRVQPRAARDQVLGYQDDALRLRVKAPPEGGRANEAAISLLAEALGITKGRIDIVRGHTSRDKLVSVESLTLEEVRRRLNVRSS